MTATASALDAIVAPHSDLWALIPSRLATFFIFPTGGLLFLFNAQPRRNTVLWTIVDAVRGRRRARLSGRSWQASSDGHDDDDSQRIWSQKIRINYVVRSVEWLVFSSMLPRPSFRACRTSFIIWRGSGLRRINHIHDNLWREAYGQTAKIGEKIRSIL